MTHSINSLQGKLWKNISIIFAVFVVVYGITRIIPILKGVTITTNNVINNDNSSITIEGIAKHAKKLSVNGRDILIDTEGNFIDEVMLSPGINRITLVAEDIRGKTHTKEIVMNGKIIKDSKPVAFINDKEQQINNN